MNRFFEINPIERILWSKQILFSSPSIKEEELLTILINQSITDQILKNLRTDFNFRRLDDCLILLDCVDRAFSDLLRYNNHIYILGDDFINKTNEGFLEILLFTGMVYRFNVATKFGYPDRNMMQTRITGWGREYCNRFFDRKSKRYRGIYEKILDIILRDKARYEEIIDLCNKKNRPLIISRIHILNANLNLKIVT